MADKETVIGVETRVSGEIRGGEDLVVKGRVDGKIQLSHALTVEKGAVVQADVDVRSLVVSGTLVGNTVASESVRLLASARVVGDLASPRLIMEAGAAYRGRVDMGDIEAARAAVASRAAAKPAGAFARPAARGCPAQDGGPRGEGGAQVRGAGRRREERRNRPRVSTGVPAGCGGRLERLRRRGRRRRSADASSPSRKPAWTCPPAGVHSTAFVLRFARPCAV
jgi:cytoskeletal protein CcmA (bactofilin family)